MSGRSERIARLGAVMSGRSERIARLGAVMSGRSERIARLSAGVPHDGTERIGVPA
jgi:hypothetical protein